MNIINLLFPPSFSWCSFSHIRYALTNPVQVYGTRRQFKSNPYNLFRQIYKSISFLWIMQLNWRYFFDGTWDMMDRSFVFEELSNTLEISLKFWNYGLNFINFLSPFYLISGFHIRIAQVFGDVSTWSLPKTKGFPGWWCCYVVTCSWSKFAFTGMAGN